MKSTAWSLMTVFYVFVVVVLTFLCFGFIFKGGLSEIDRSLTINFYYLLKNEG